MKTPRSFLALAALGCLPLVHVGSITAKPADKTDKTDYTLLEKLPERETAAKKTAHEGWDSGVTSKMLAATAAYNEALTGMVSDLATTYYGKAKVTKEEVAGYAKALKSAAEFRHRLDNPKSEDRGSLDALEAPSVVSSDLEDTIDQMVQAVTEGDERFDYEKWEKRWDEARKTGDTPEPEATEEPEKTEKPEKTEQPEKAEKPEMPKDAAPATKRDKAD